MSIDDALAAISVEEQDENGWFPVSTADAGGIIARFAREQDAYRFRLAEVNRLLNG